MANKWEGNYVTHNFRIIWRSTPGSQQYTDSVKAMRIDEIMRE